MMLCSLLLHLVICWLMAVQVKLPCLQIDTAEHWCRQMLHPFTNIRNLCKLLASTKQCMPVSVLLFGCTVRRYLERGRTNAAKSSLMSAGWIKSCSCALSTVTLAPVESLSGLAAGLFPSLMSSQLMRAWRPLDNKFYIWGKDAQGVCPEAW